MAMITYPLNDVMYTAEDAELYNCTRTSGVYSGEDFSCTVSGTNNNVTIGEGIGWIRNSRFSGKVFANKAPVTLALDIADAANPRIDVVAVRFDAAANTTDLVIKKGTAAASPAMPEIVQTESVYELYLFSVYRETAATVITADNVTDLRLDASVCGLMADAVTSVDTSAINAQFTALLAKIKQELADLKHDKIDAYTKEETLSPSTKTALGLSEDAVPDDAFASLGWHNWATRALEAYMSASGIRATIKEQASEATDTFYYSDEITINRAGKISLVNPSSVTYQYDAGGGIVCEELSNKYFATSDGNLAMVYKGGETVYRQHNASGGYYTWMYYVDEYSVRYGTKHYVSSANRHAYPDNGIVDNVEYEYLGSPLENAKEAYGMRLHWWKRRTEESGYFENIETISVHTIVEGMSSDSSFPLSYSDAITIDTAGAVSLSNAIQTVIYISGGTINFDEYSYLIGKYVRYSNGDIFKLNGDSLIKTVQSSGTYKVRLYSVDKISTEYRENIGEYEYVSSPDRNAYPDSGVEGIFSYQYLAVPFENAREGAKVVTGSYVGTGTFGASNPNSLSFETKPKAVFLTALKIAGGTVSQMFGSITGDNECSAIYTEFLTTTYTQKFGFRNSTAKNNGYAKISEDGKTISWYTTDNNLAQCNASNYTYYYYAIL